MDRAEVCSRFLEAVPYTLYPFQEEALLAWFEAEGGVLVSAPTGMGKTLIAEAAIFEALHTRQRMTILVVTHDMTIARRTQRALVMKDGRIVREDIIGKPFEEDLKVFKQSGLGRALRGVDTTAVSLVGEFLTPGDQAVLVRILGRVPG